MFQNSYQMLFRFTMVSVLSNVAFKSSN